MATTLHHPFICALLEETIRVSGLIPIKAGTCAEDEYQLISDIEASYLAGKEPYNEYTY